MSAYVLRGKTGMRAGFDLYEDSIEMRSGAGLGGLQRPGRETLGKLLPWVREHAGGPFFLFFHLYEPHTPYDPPPELAARAGSAYDGEISLADQVVGELVAELRRLGLYDRALIVLLSDHGEGLGEHGEEEHGLLLYRETIQVPLLLKLPQGRFAGRSVAAPVQLVDVAPTLHDLLGLERPAGWRGSSLLGFLDSGAPERRIYSETFYPRLHFGSSELTSLLDLHHHLIDGPDPELFALDRDPGERYNVLTAERRRFAELRQELAGYLRELAPPSAVDAETTRAMAALGYLGGTGAPVSGPLPDPKSQLPSLAKLRAGFQLMHEKKWVEAEATFHQLVELNPQMVDAWEFLGRARMKLGRPDEALAAYQEALKRSGGAPQVAQNVASILFDLGRLDDAAAHARLAEAASPSFTHGLLARIAMQRKDLAGAEREARLALEDTADRILPHLTLAEVLQAQGKYEASLAELGLAREAYAQRRAEDPDLMQGTRLLEGMALADLGDATSAEKAFREEMRLFPDDPRAYANLALLLALTGRSPEAGDTLRRMTEAIPTPDAYAEAVRVLRALRNEEGARTVLAYARKRYPDSTLLASLAAAR